MGARTHIHGSKEIFKLINDLLEVTAMKGVIFEENLSSHQANAVLDYFRKELNNFVSPRFIPVNMTIIIQVIDRHTGGQYT